MSSSVGISSDEVLVFDYGVFVLFSIVLLIGFVVYFTRKPLSELLQSEIKVEFRELGMDDADDVEIGPGIMLVQSSKLNEKFVLEDSGSEDIDSDTEEETT